jgi:recombination protein RecT
MSDNVPATTTTTAVAKTEGSMSERFMTKVISEFGTGVGEIALTNFQKRLVQNYFMAIDDALKKSEEKRNTQKEVVPATWANVNMEKLSRDVIACARVGLDPSEANHISPVLYKNNKTKKYDISFITRYRGLELKAKKYGLDVPDAVIVELVHANDHFKSIKKDFKNRVESYEFDIKDEFDRGEVRGGFYYHVFYANPEKNKLVVFSKKDIDKRKPKYASAEFWGGEKDVWENGKKTGKEVVDGWYEKMAWKTIYRAAYSDITIDSQKIDDDYRRLSQIESGTSTAEFEAEYVEVANSETLHIPEDTGLEEGEVVDPETGEVIQDEQKAEETETKKEPESGKVQTGLPGFAVE